MNKNELKKREKLKLQKLAEKDEHVRYKIERIESLEKNARRNKTIVILNAITSGLFAISAVGYLMQGLTTNPEVFKQLPFYSNAFCSVIWGLIGRMNNKERQRIEEEITEQKREVLGYSK